MLNLISQLNSNLNLLFAHSKDYTFIHELLHPIKFYLSLKPSVSEIQKSFFFWGGGIKKKKRFSLSNFWTQKIFNLDFDQIF